VAVSGFGNVAWGAVQKINELGGKVVTLSGPDGFIHDKDGVKGEKINYMLDLRLSGEDVVKPYADKFKVDFYPDKRPWAVKVDVALPCATQNELDENDAKTLIKNNCTCICEAANMPSTPEAIDVFLKSKILYGPGKAANAGGVAVSGLEMSQNALRMSWTSEEVDGHLQRIMKTIHKDALETSIEYNQKGNYVVGANITGFLKVADAMMAQGIV
ncbi:MAG: glutamate dehydrogenase, partial [Elusimicrobiota bacterium]|nr:glutamate dehydrogenase [Elusimicrobiota bacterium]